MSGTNWFSADAIPPDGGNDEIQARFLEFHEAHPEVYDALRRYAFRVMESGRKSYAIAAVWERLRWFWDFEREEDEEPPKLNNDFRSRYARLLMAREPELSGLFELRALKSGRGPLPIRKRQETKAARRLFGGLRLAGTGGISASPLSGPVLHLAPKICC
jgi:hypothetical protein